MVLNARWFESNYWIPEVLVLVPVVHYRSFWSRKVGGSQRSLVREQLFGGVQSTVLVSGHQ